MRKKFLLFVLVPALIFLLIVYLFIDRWVESGLEYAGEKIVGAKVEIDGLRVTLIPIGIEFQRLQVANPTEPWKNSFETGKVRFALDFGQLLRNKFIIETMEVNNLVLGTKRTSDGSLPKPPIAKPSSAGTTLTEAARPALKQDEKKTPMFDLAAARKTLNIDSLLNPNNLAAYRRIDTLRRQVHEAGVEWNKTALSFEASKEQLSKVEATVKSINVSTIKDVQAATDALNSVKSAYDGMKNISKTFQERKSALTDNINRFSTSIAQLDDLAKEDYRNVVKLARLPDLSMKGLAELVLGKEILTRAYTYLGYIELAKEKIPQSSSKPPIETPRRMEGQVIHFPAERAYPKVWIKKILLSGGTDKAQDPNYFYACGQILNITNDQRITGFPLTAAITATKGGTTTLTLDASFDRRKGVPVDDYKARLSGLAVGDMELGRTDFIPSKVTNATADASITVHVPGHQFDSNTRVELKNMTLAFESAPRNMVERIVHDVLSSVKGFYVNLRMWRDADKFDVAFATDLDDQLTSRTKKVLGDELTKIQNEIRSKVEAAVAEKRRDLERVYNQKRDEVMGRVKSYEAMVDEKLALVESKKKELEAKVDAEKKKQEEALKKKAGDVLKGILKK